MAADLQGVEVLTEDFADVIRQFDSPTTVFLLDPPFCGTQNYEYNLSNERFRELGAVLEDIQGRFILSTSSTRTGAECMARHPFAWWRRSALGAMPIRQLTTSNYPLTYERINLADFGVKAGRFQTPPVRVEEVQTLAEVPMPKTVPPRTVLPESHKNLMVMLSDLGPLNGHWNRWNRVEMPNLVVSIGDAFNPNGVGVLVAIRTRKGEFIVIDGHHRFLGMHRWCKARKINPAAFAVRIDYFNEAEIPGDVGLLVDSIRGLPVNPSDIHDDLSARWPGTPWGAQLPYGLVIADTNRNGLLTSTNILKARLMADQVLALTTQTGSASDALSAVRMPKDHDAIVATLNHPKASATAAFLRTWHTKVVKPTKKFGNAHSLVFPILVLEDMQGRQFFPIDRLWRPIVSDTRYQNILPRGSDSLKETVGRLLQVVNSGSWSQIIHILGNRTSTEQWKPHR